MRTLMVYVLIGIIALIAIFAGYLLNFYTVVTLALILFVYLRCDTKRINESEHKSKRTEGGILAYGLFAPFAVIMLITSFIVNFPLVVSFAESFLRLILR